MNTPRPHRFIRWPRLRLPAAPADRSRWLTPFLLEGLLLLVGIWAALTISLPGQYGQLVVGVPSPMSIWAPAEVSYISEVLTSERRAQAENSMENLVYVYDPQLPIQQRQSLVALLDTISSVRDDPSMTYAQRLSTLATLPNAALELSMVRAELILLLDSTGWEQLRTQVVEIYDRAIERYDYAIDERALIQLRERWLTYWLATTSLTPDQRELAMFFTESFLRVNRTLDETATALRREASRDSVPPQSMRVLAGERIVSVGEIITPAIIEKLQRTGAMPQSLSWADVTGRGLLAMVLAVGFLTFALAFEPRLARHPRSFGVLLLIMVVTVLIARLLLPSIELWPHFFPLATIAIVVTVVFNGRLSLATAVLMSIVIGVIEQSSLEITATLFATCLVATLITRSADRLLPFVLAGLGVTLVSCVGQFTFWLMQAPSGTITDLGNRVTSILLVATLNGLFSTILSLGIFNLVSRIAGQVTPLQLMELAHPSRPLLRKLIREAPGTYYHSVAVGNLAEAAAEAIGADALLLRVAAYYHDIGKTIRPYFFTDNQLGRENVHNELDPFTSAQIIIDHVREGVKMAQSAGLPLQITDFIATHHGTGLIRHFYQQALQQEDSVREEDFRYPGPRPQTREQAILMLADSVEATVRSKTQNGKLAPMQAGPGQTTTGAQRLEDIVQMIIELRVREGELDQAPLTMRELSLIRQAFVVSLRSIYHPRVDYAPILVGR